AIPYVRLQVYSSLFKEASKPDQNYRAHKCHDNRADHAAAGPDSQLSEYPAAQNAAEQTENDVHHYAVAATLHELTCQPTRYQTDQNPCEESHGCSPFCELGWESPLDPLADGECALGPMKRPSHDWICP